MPPDRYEETTRKYLDKCGWNAKVGVIVETMREEEVAVGLWPNPMLNALTGLGLLDIREPARRISTGRSLRSME